MIVRDGTPANGSGNGVDSFTITLSTSRPGCVVMIGISNSNSAVTTVVPTATGLTFTQTGSTETVQGGSSQVYWAYAAAQLASTVITCTASPSGKGPQLTGWAVGYIGCNTTSPIDAIASTSNAGSNGLSQAVTTVTPGALVIGHIDENNTNTMVPGAGITLVQQTPALTFSDSGLLENNLPTMSPGSVTMSFTLGGSFIPDALHAIALKPASGFKINALRPHAFSPGLAR